MSETGETLDYWTLSTTDVRGLEKVVSGRLAALWYSITNFTVDINFTDGLPHKLSIYCVDWDLTTRRQTIAVKDANSGAVLNTQNLNSSFNGGLYLSWNITGHVKLVFTNVGSCRNAVVSGLFFDSFPTPPTGGYGIVSAGAGLTRTIGVDANGSPIVRQYHMDGQGSVLAITDGLGNVVTNYQIDAWGNVLSGSAPGNAFDYLGGLGYWADPDLGMHYVRARWMNPQTGSWLSVDPSLSQFAYQYAGNAPTTNTDPSGMDSETDQALAVLGSPNYMDLTPHQIRLLLREDANHKLRHPLTDQGRGMLCWLLSHLEAVRTAKSLVGSQDPNAPRSGGAQPQNRNSKAQQGHPGAPAGPGAGNPPRAPIVLTPQEKDWLHWAGIDYLHPQDVPAQRVIERMGALNAHHISISDVQNPEAQGIQAALTYREALHHGNPQDAAVALKNFYTSLHDHVPGVVQNPYRDDPSLGLRFTGQGTVLGIQTGGAALLDSTTWGHAKQLTFGHLDVDYYKGQLGFESAATYGAGARETLLWTIPVEKIALVLGRGANAVRATQYGDYIALRLTPATARLAEYGRIVSRPASLLRVGAIKALDRGTEKFFQSSTGRRVAYAIVKRLHPNARMLEKDVLSALNTTFDWRLARERIMRAKGAVDEEGRVFGQGEAHGHHVFIPEGREGKDVARILKHNRVNVVPVNAPGSEALGRLVPEHQEIDMYAKGRAGTRRLLPQPFRWFAGNPVWLTHSVVAGAGAAGNGVTHSQLLPHWPWDVDENLDDVY